MTPDPAISDRIIVALDVPTVSAARALVADLGDAGTFYKIGHQLQFAGGLELARDLVAAGKKVFLDVKLHDIPNTVAHGIARLADLGLTFVTVHAYPQTMRAAAEAAAGSPMTILGVTVLTSMGDADLDKAGYRMSAAPLTDLRARQALDAGIGGLVCSPLEAERLRTLTGPDMTLVTPGVRPTGAAADDQKRVATPAAAIAAGANHLVVGRPIAASDTPKDALLAIAAEVAGVLSPAVS